MPFAVPDQVPWPELVNLLDTKFKSLTERGLTHENKQYLATKLFGEGYCNTVKPYIQNRVGREGGGCIGRCDIFQLLSIND